MGAGGQKVEGWVRCSSYTEQFRGRPLNVEDARGSVRIEGNLVHRCLVSTGVVSKRARGRVQGWKL